MPRKFLPRGIQAAQLSVSHRDPLPPRILSGPFITIAQQVGAEAFSLPQRLADLLNARDKLPTLDLLG